MRSYLDADAVNKLFPNHSRSTCTRMIRKAKQVVEVTELQPNGTEKTVPFNESKRAKWLPKGTVPTDIWLQVYPDSEEQIKEM